MSWNMPMWNRDGRIYCRGGFSKMYKWLSPKRGGTIWIYRDSVKGAGGLVWKDGPKSYWASSPTEMGKKRDGVWMHDEWGESKTLAGAKKIVEDRVRGEEV